MQDFFPSSLSPAESIRIDLTLPPQNGIFNGYGEMSEGFMEPVLKTGDTETYRGFESHSLRHRKLVSDCFWLTSFPFFRCFFKLFYFSHKSGGPVSTWSWGLPT